MNTRSINDRSSLRGRLRSSSRTQQQDLLSVDHAAVEPEPTARTATAPAKPPAPAMPPIPSVAS